MGYTLSHGRYSFVMKQKIQTNLTLASTRGKGKTAGLIRQVLAQYKLILLKMLLWDVRLWPFTKGVLLKRGNRKRTGLTQVQQIRLQSNFKGSNTFGAMKICTRQGQFKLISVNYSARSGGIIEISFRFSST